VDQSRGLERLTGTFLSHLLRSQSSQFFVDQRQKLFSGLRIALLDCGEDLRDVSHIGPEGASKRFLSIAASDLPNPPTRPLPTLTSVGALRDLVRNVRLMHGLRSQFRGHPSMASDFHKTFEFSARESCVKKRVRIRDEPGRGSHLTVVWRDFRKRGEIPGIVTATNRETRVIGRMARKDLLASDSARKFACEGHPLFSVTAQMR
jgi:hypothetical protein